MPAWFTPLLLLLDGLAVFRLTRLITDDTIPFGRLRLRVEARWPNAWFTELATCPWCMSVWVAAGVLGAHALVPAWWPYAAAVLAFSAVAGLLSSWA